MVSGRPDNGGQRVENVFFDNVNITIAKLSNYSRPCHDYRPSAQPDVVTSSVDGIYVENVDGLVLKDSTVTFQHPRQPDSGQCFSQVNSTDIQKSSLTCHE